MNRGTRRTDDGTYPNAQEERNKTAERARTSGLLGNEDPFASLPASLPSVCAPPQPFGGVTITDTSTTWEQGHLKVIMRTLSKDGKTERTVKAIDLRPLPNGYGRGQRSQWEGTLEEFLAYGASVALLADVVRKSVA